MLVWWPSRWMMAQCWPRLPIFIWPTYCLGMTAMNSLGSGCQNTATTQPWWDHISGVIWSRTYTWAIFCPKSICNTGIRYGWLRLSHFWLPFQIPQKWPLKVRPHLDWDTRPTAITDPCVSKLRLNILPFCYPKYIPFPTDHVSYIFFLTMPEQVKSKKKKPDF